MIEIVSRIKQYQGPSTDTKPKDNSVYPGSTFHEVNTGALFVYYNGDWIDDLRYIYAISQGIKP